MTENIKKESTLADIFPDGSVMFRNISSKGKCYTDYKAMLFCFETKAKSAAFTGDCKHFIQTWDACLKRHHFFRKLDKSS